MTQQIYLMVAAMIAAAAAWPASAQQPTVKSGIEAWQRSEFDAAVAIWRPLAEAGDPDAAFNLGQAYRLGRGVTLNLAAAQTWLERAARKNHLDAQATLGLLLFQNGNRTGALRWLRAAAERGEPRALLMYGTALYNGDGVLRDPALAYAYVSRAAAQGLAPAKTTLEEMNEAIPLETRQRGLAIARQRVAEAQPPKVTPPTTAAKPATKPVTANPVAPATLANTASGPWRIQLGAFSHRSSAESLFKRLASNGALAGKRPFLVAAGAMTRLQVGPFATRAAAAAACAGLKGQPCFPVAGK